MKILLVGTQMATGGAQKVLLDQAGWFHERGDDVMAVFIYDREDLHETWQRGAKYPILDLHGFKKGAGAIVNLFSLLQGLGRLWTLIRKNKPDVIETFTHDCNVLILPLAWAARIPVRIATHHGKIEGFSRWKEIVHASIVNSMATCIVAVSERTRQQSQEEGIRADKIVMIPNGITPVSVADFDRHATRAELGFAEGDVFLLSVGRLVYQKAHEYLVSAMPAVLKEMPNIKVGICGDGVLRADLEEQIHSLGLGEKVKLFGMQSDVTKFLAAADVFVLPSRWEGLPIALLEAMSAGLPIIATRVEGVDQTVENGVHGLLVSPGSPEELAKAILQLSAAPEQRRVMGEAGRAQILERYTIDQMCEQYLNLFKQDAGKGKTSAAEKGTGGA